MWHLVYPSYISRRKLREKRPKQPLVSFSDFWLLILLLMLGSGPVYAEWMTVERDYLALGLQTVYVDSDSIRREGNLVTIGQLIDFKWMQGSARGPTRFMSTKTHKQFDCAGKRLRLLAFTEFSHRMGTGILADGYVDTSRWMPVEPDSINQAVLEVVCSKESLR